MKIVYCVPSLHNAGGIEQVLSFKANALADKSGYEVHIVTTSRVMAAGRLCKQKGFDLLIQAWGLLPTSLREEWHLDIFGSGDDQAPDDVESFAQKLASLMRSQEDMMRISREAMKRIKSDFSEEIVMDKWETLFEELYLN